MSDFRFDPFRFEYRPVNIFNEQRQVEYFPSIRRVGFFLSETPQRLQSQRVSIVCGGDTLAEVGRTVQPPIGNFRVDYGNVSAFASTGFIEVHPSRIGQVAFINYRGLGKNLNSSHRPDSIKNFQRSVWVSLDSMSTGLDAIDGITLSDSVISANDNRISSVSDAIMGQDMANYSQCVSAILKRGRLMRFTSGSGAFTPPANTRYVLLFFCGSGGAGSGCISGLSLGGAGGGGAGSPVSFAMIDLSLVSGGPPYSWSVAPATPTNPLTIDRSGVSTTIFSCSSGYGRGGTYNAVTGAGTGGAVVNSSFTSAALISRVYPANAGANNSGTTSGAGGRAGIMSGELFKFITAGNSGGASVSGNTNGNSGANFGNGGSGGGGAIPDTIGGGGGGGFLCLIF